LLRKIELLNGHYQKLDSVVEAPAEPAKETPVVESSQVSEASTEEVKEATEAVNTQNSLPQGEEK
jgi:hypothetical protein